MESSIETRATCSRKLQNCSSDGGGGLDRISNLPESIICYILSLLPTKCVVATSLLSKRWKFLWTQVSTLNFDDFSDDPGRKDEDSVSFLQFVNKVFILHNSEKIEKFRLSWKNNECQASYVNTWVNRAISRNVKVLDLGVGDVARDWLVDDYEDLLVHLPSSLFTCRTLESLSLDGPFWVDVPSVVCLPKLVVLNLSLVLYRSDESVSKLLSGCPVLHTLRIERYGHAYDNVAVYAISSASLRRLEIHTVDEDGAFELDDKLEIDAPALEYLDVLDYTVQEFSVRGLTSLNEAHLDLREKNPDGCKTIFKLVQAMDRVKVLKLSSDTSFAVTRAATRLSATFERLTKLVVECYCSGWRFLKDLLDCSAKLEVLNIKKLPAVADYGACCWDAMHIPDCLTYSLAQVSFSGFEGHEDELAIIRFILKHGVVMKKIEISSTNACDLKKKLAILQNISMFPRVSRDCQIKFS